MFDANGIFSIIRQNLTQLVAGYFRLEYRVVSFKYQIYNEIYDRLIFK